LVRTESNCKGELGIRVAWSIGDMGKNKVYGRREGIWRLIR